MMASDVVAKRPQVFCDKGVNFMRRGRFRTRRANFAGAAQVLEYLDFFRDNAASLVLGMEIAGGCLI
jgi:hypothetical protein